MTEIDPHIATTNQAEESKEIENNIIRKVTWNSKILKSKSKETDSNFLVVFSYSKA